MKYFSNSRISLRRRLLSIVMAVLIGTTSFAADIFAELSGMPQVESTYVSGRFAHNKKYWYSNTGRQSVDLTRGFSALYSYECYSEEAVKKARKILEDYLKKNPDVEIMMKTIQDKQEYVIYEKFTDDDKVSQMIIWNSDAPNVCEIVVIDWNKGLEPNRSPYSFDPSAFGFNFVFNENLLIL